MGLDAPTVHLGFPKVGGAKDNDFNEQKTCLQTWDFNEDPESLQHFFRLHRLFSYNIFFCIVMFNRRSATRLPILFNYSNCWHPQVFTTYDRWDDDQIWKGHQVAKDSDRK
jgi:hypothetical protein